ncbi:MAG: peptide deformylase [Lachnospiraceae bacterium]|nr:peptide deformylase [Lachnospiraceae bacterium]
MAIRQIRKLGDSILGKKSREITEMNGRISTLIDDMLETMYEAQGVGLAAPQVGILKRVVVIDVSEEADQPIVLINPVIVETAGEQTGNEGCLSVPGKTGVVTRPNYVKVRAKDRRMQEIELEGTELLARAICHELDHLEGILYVEKVEGDLHDAGKDWEE